MDALDVRMPYRLLSSLEGVPRAISINSIVEASESKILNPMEMRSFFNSQLELDDKILCGKLFTDFRDMEGGWSSHEDFFMQNGQAIQEEERVSDAFANALGKKRQIEENHESRITKHNKFKESPSRTGQWSVSENQKLIKIVSEQLSSFGEICWKEVAREFGERNCGQCRKRWIHYLDPELCTDEYSPEENETIIHHVLNEGTGWAAVVKKIYRLYKKKRSAVFVEKHWKLNLRKEFIKNKMQIPPLKKEKKLTVKKNYSCINEGESVERPKLSRWTPLERKSLLEIVANKHGDQKWKEVACELNSGKTAFECYRYWKNYLQYNPQLNQWTKEEDQTIKELVIALGPKWITIAKKIKEMHGKNRISTDVKKRCSEILNFEWSILEHKMTADGFLKSGETLQENVVFNPEEIDSWLNLDKELETGSLKNT